MTLALHHLYEQTIGDSKSMLDIAACTLLLRIEDIVAFQLASALSEDPKPWQRLKCPRPGFQEAITMTGSGAPAFGSNSWLLGLKPGYVAELYPRGWQNYFHCKLHDRFEMYHLSGDGLLESLVVVFKSG